MSRPPATSIGDGSPAVVLNKYERKWPGLEVTFQTDDISRPTDWRIHSQHHAIVVHLGGLMQRLETELDGFGGSSGPALPGEVWTAPAERKYASHASGAKIDYALILLDPDALDQISGSRKGRVNLAPLAGIRDEFLFHTVRKLKAATTDTNDLSEMLGQSLSQTICLHLCQTYSPGRGADPIKPEPGPKLHADTARKLREFIHDNLGQRIALDDLAKLADMTTHHLLLAFRKAFDSTPAQYVIRQRLRRVQRQLVHTKKDITTIALEAGFSSHSHLTACFHQHLSCSPSTFRATAKSSFFQVEPADRWNGSSR
jgi:AraC family transcriptional regulator